MEILQLIYDDPENPWLGGGGAIRTSVINSLLAKWGNRVTVVTGAYPGCKRKEVKNGVTYIRIGTGKNYQLSRFSYSVLAGKYIRTISHEILVEEFSGNSLTFAPFFARKPSVAVIQNYFGFRIILKNLLFGLPSWLYEKFLLKKFKYFIPVSSSLIQKIQIPENRAIVIPQGIDPIFLDHNNSEEKYFLFIGRLDFYQKGIDILLKSFRNNLDLNIRLLIVGGGDRKKLWAMIEKEGIKEYVDYYPRVAHNDLVKIYAGAYFLCLPSRYEGWPLVCLECYAQGRPVLGTDITGLKDVLVHGRTGIKVASDNELEFTQAMRSLAENKKIRDELGNNAREFAKDYLWERIAEKQLGFYKSIISKNQV